MMLCFLLLCCIHAVQHSTEDDLLQLIHRGGLITLLKGCVSQRHNVPRQDSPEDAIDTLTELWTKKAAEVSKDLYKRIEGGHTAWQGPVLVPLSDADTESMP